MEEDNSVEEKPVVQIEPAGETSTETTYQPDSCLSDLIKKLEATMHQFYRLDDPKKDYDQILTEWNELSGQAVEMINSASEARLVYFLSPAGEAKRSALERWIALSTTATEVWEAYIRTNHNSSWGKIAKSMWNSFSH